MAKPVEMGIFFTHGFFTCPSGIRPGPPLQFGMVQTAATRLNLPMDACILAGHSYHSLQLASVCNSSSATLWHLQLSNNNSKYQQTMILQEQYCSHNMIIMIMTITTAIQFCSLCAQRDGMPVTFKRSPSHLKSSAPGLKSGFRGLSQALRPGLVLLRSDCFQPRETR